MITILEYQLFEPLSLYVKWQCDIVSAHYYKVYRGISPESLTPLAATLNNYYSDISLVKERLLVDLYFKIEAYDINNQLLDEYLEHFDSIKLNNYLKYRKWFQANFLKATNKSAAGRKIVLLQRKQTGVPCSVCSHPQTGEPQNPRCTTCWGTGFDGGFYSPMVMSVLFGNFMARVATHGTENHTNKEFDSIVAYAYPQMYDGDYVVNLNTGSRYRVSGDGVVYNRYDFNRLGSVTYTIEKLDAHHPIYLYPVQENITSITGITLNRIAQSVTVTGTLLRPRYGSLYLAVWDTTPTIKEFIPTSGNTLSDMAITGEYTGLVNVNLLIEIDGLGTPDTFRWSVNGGTTWEEELVPVATHTLGTTGITVTFTSVTGHGSGDSWTAVLGPAPTLAYQEDLHADSLARLTDDVLVFNCSTELAQIANAEYRIVCNNDYYKGDIAWI